MAYGVPLLFHWYFKWSSQGDYSVHHSDGLSFVMQSITGSIDSVTQRNNFPDIFSCARDSNYSKMDPFLKEDLIYLDIYSYFSVMTAVFFYLPHTSCNIKVARLWQSVAACTRKLAYVYSCACMCTPASPSPRLCENKAAREKKGNICALKFVLEYFYSRCVSSKNRQKRNSRHSNQKWKKRPFHPIKNVFTKASTKWRTHFFCISWIYFSFLTVFHICVASKQRAALLWIMKGLYSSLASLLQSAKPTTTSTAHRHVYGWDVARRTSGTGRNRTPRNKKPSAICTADISHTSERARASGVHLSACAGFEVVVMSCRHVVCVQEPVWATWHV